MFKWMILTLSGAILAFTTATAHAIIDNWDVEGANGKIYVHGYLVEGPCRLELSSVYQEVNLGVTSSSRLLRKGDRGDPVPVIIKLRDCIRTTGYINNLQSGNLSTTEMQPIVSTGFFGVGVDDEPNLISVEGAAGVGLRILDKDFQPIKLGMNDTAQFLVPGDNELVFYVATERTSAPLSANAYQAMVGFTLRYE